MRRFGAGLGMAFQIQDDVLDITGEEQVVGKSLGKDLDAGKLTLPLIRYLSAADDRRRAQMVQLISTRDAAGLRSRLLEEGVVADAQRIAAELVEQAKAELDHLTPGPARDLLDTLAQAVVSRRF